VRFGYRRVHVLLQREGWAINRKKTYRLYKELGMQLRNKTPLRMRRKSWRLGAETITSNGQTARSGTRSRRRS